MDNVSEEVLQQLNAMDRYARRVFSRRKFGIRGLDAAQEDNNLKIQIGLRTLRFWQNEAKFSNLFKRGWVSPSQIKCTRLGE
jgi:hypothetical protein